MNSITLNEFVDKVYCLNLKNRTDRMIHMDDQFSIIGVEYERFDAVNGRDLSEEEITVCHDDFKTKDQARGAQGAIKTHRSVLKDAIDNDYEKIAVFEDDLVFCSDFKDRFEYYVSSVPNDWDIMYLGCHYHACPNPKLVKPYIYKNIKSYGCFAMIIKKEMIRRIYEESTNETKPIDNYVAELVSKTNCYSFVPFFVKTINTVSDVSTDSDSFEYDIVNKHFSDRVLLVKINRNKEIKRENPQVTIKDSINYMIRNKKDFLLFKGGTKVFESQGMFDNIYLYNDHVKIYGGKILYYKDISLKIK